MNNTWVKLYRKTIENGILKDQSAWVVFSWILLMVDKDTGRRTVGRYQMSDELGIKPNTLYKVLHRLEKKWGVIKLVSQKTYTEVLVVNWSKYQHTQEDQSNDSQKSVKTTSIASNTKQEYKNKEIKNNIYSTLNYLRELPDGDLESFVEKYNVSRTQVLQLAEQLLLWCETNNKRKSNYKAFLQNRLLDKFGYRPITQTYRPELPEISEAERLKNLDRIAEIKARFKN